MYTIRDENGDYVDANGIMCFGNDFYYFPRKSPNEGIWHYPLEGIQKAIDKLELHNRLGGLGHRFEIVEMI